MEIYLMTKYLPKRKALVINKNIGLLGRMLTKNM